MKTYKLLFLLIAISIGNFLFAQTPTIQWQQTYGGSIDDEGFAVQQTTDGGYIIAGWTYSNDGNSWGNHSVNDDYLVVKLKADGDTSWSRSFGGSDWDDARDVKQTNDGGYIVVGYSKSTDGDVSGNHGGSFDIWVIKLTLDGNIEWQKSLGGDDEEIGYSIQQTADNGYVIVGTTKSNNGDVTGNNGGLDIWVVKLFSNGNIDWSHCFGGSTEDQGRAIIQTSDNGYMIAGYTNSNNNDFSGLHNSAGGYYDCCLLKLDASGNKSWTKLYGGEVNDRYYSIKETSDNNFICGGSSSSGTGDLTVNKGGSDFWIVKVNSSTHSILWQKSYGGSNLDECFSIGLTTDGGYIAAGFASSNDMDVKGNHGATDYWIIKLTSSGDTSWTKTLGGSSNERQIDLASYGYGCQIQETADGGYIIGGTTQSSDGDISNFQGIEDYWIVKLNPTATTCNLSISPSKINVDSSSGSAKIYVTSSSNWTANLSSGCSWLTINPMSGTGDDSITVTYSANTSSILRSCSIMISCGSVTKLDTISQSGTTGFWELKINSFAVEVAPNPIINTANLSFEKPGFYQIIIRDIFGREINNFKTDFTNSVKLNFDKSANGVYFYKINGSDGKSAVGKIILNK